MSTYQIQLRESSVEAGWPLWDAVDTRTGERVCGAESHKACAKLLWPRLNHGLQMRERTFGATSFFAYKKGKKIRCGGRQALYADPIEVNDIDEALEYLESSEPDGDIFYE